MYVVASLLVVNISCLSIALQLTASGLTSDHETSPLLATPITNNMEPFPPANVTCIALVHYLILLKSCEKILQQYNNMTHR